MCTHILKIINERKYVWPPSSMSQGEIRKQSEQPWDVFFIPLNQ